MPSEGAPGAMRQRRLAIAAGFVALLATVTVLMATVGRPRESHEGRARDARRPGAAGVGSGLPLPSAEAETGFMAAGENGQAAVVSLGPTRPDRRAGARPARPGPIRAQAPDRVLPAPSTRAEATRSAPARLPPQPASSGQLSAGPAASAGAADAAQGAPSHTQAEQAQPAKAQAAEPQSGAPAPQSPEVAAPAVPPPAAVPPAGAPSTPSLAQPILVPPVPISLPPPRHPLPYRMVVDAPGLAGISRLEAVEARVRLRLLVREDGSVGRVEIAVSSGRPELDGAAAAAARSWQFLPAHRDGNAIDSTVLIWVSFVVGP